MGFDFMRTVLPELDRRDYIVRYAWFTDYSSNQLWTSALFDDEGVLTPLGEFYAQHSANPAAGPGKPYPAPMNQEGNLLRNGGFDLGDNGDWGGYEKRFVSIDQTDTHEGAFCVKLRGGFSSAIDQRVNLEAGRTYRVTQTRVGLHRRINRHRLVWKGTGSTTESLAPVSTRQNGKRRVLPTPPPRPMNMSSGFGRGPVNRQPSSSIQRPFASRNSSN